MDAMLLAMSILWGWIAFVIIMILVFVYLLRPLKPSEIESVKVLPRLKEKTKENQIKQAIARLLHNHGKYIEDYESISIVSLATMYGDIGLDFEFLFGFIESEYGIHYSICEEYDAQIFIRMVCEDLNKGANESLGETSETEQESGEGALSDSYFGGEIPEDDSSTVSGLGIPSEDVLESSESKASEGEISSESKASEEQPEKTFPQEDNVEGDSGDSGSEGCSDGGGDCGGDD